MSISTELTALQADVTNARTAIETKGGTVTSGGGSSQLASDIASIPSGGTTDVKITFNGRYANNYAILRNATMACDSLEVTYVYNAYTEFAFSGLNLPGASLFKVIHQTPPTNLSGSFSGVKNSAASVETLNIVGDLSGVVNYSSCFYASGIKNITGSPIDFTSATAVTYMFEYNSVIEEVRFVPNSLSVSIDWGLASTTFAHASNDTLISLANSIAPQTSGTWQAGNTSSKLANIYGDVVDGLFVKNTSGSMTLANFVTNVKGWTLA